MGREAKRARAGGDLVKITVMLTGDEVRAIDAEAERLTKADELGRVVNRTDVIKYWLRVGRETAAKR